MSPESQSQDPRLDRRTFVKGLGVAGAGAVGLSGRGRLGAVGGAQAVAPLLAVGAIGASAAVGWALREYEVLGQNPPAEGLTAGALEQDAYQTIKTRASTNKSTIVDNRNILDGVKHTAYTDAKIAAIEALNAGETEANVLSAAQAAVDSYQTTIRKNFLKTWVEAVSELQSLKAALDSHPNTNYSNVIGHYGATLGFNENGGNAANGPVTHTFPDGTTLDVPTLYMAKSDDVNGKIEYNPLVEDAFAGPGTVSVTATYDGDTVSYFNSDAWKEINNSMVSTFQNVRTGIETWVNNVYGQVQAGSIEISNLLTPRERAATMANEEGGSQALADLIALNIPVDLENEATITIPSTGTTLRGSFGLTDESDGPLEAGQTYDPSTFNGDVYFTTDVSLLDGDWTAFNPGVDGGNVTVTEEPYEGTILSVTTTADETITVPAAEWNETAAGGNWTYNASGDLENPITQVSSVDYFSDSESTQYETLNLSAEFTIEKFENTETGEETQSATFTSAKPQNDTNYINQAEWDELEQQNQELIEKYEESQQNAGGANVPGAQTIADLLGVDVGTGAAIAVATGIAGVLLLTQR